MIKKEVQELLSFIDGNPTAYHTTASVRKFVSTFCFQLKTSLTS